MIGRRELVALARRTRLELGELYAKRIDARSQLRVVSTRERHHAAAHPLAKAAELRVVELRHGTMALAHGGVHETHRRWREAVTIGDAPDQDVVIDVVSRRHRGLLVAWTQLVIVRP